MIVDCIGCLHGARPKLEGGDLLIVTGDYTSKHEISEFIMFLQWLEKQQYSMKILIGGNHDTFLDGVQLPNGLLPYTIPKNTIYLQNSGTEFQGLKIWGSPWTAQFKGINPKCTAFTVKHFDHTDELLEEYWNKIPSDIDILITHGPPFDILDHVKDRDCDGSYDCSIPTGSKSLVKKVLEVKPKLHVFSHIHEQGGKEYKKDTINFVNCSIMNENYKPVNKPIRVYL